MTKAEFMVPMNRLISTFGSKFYPSTKMSAVYELFKEKPLWLWADTVQRAILNLRMAPVPKMLVTLGREIQQEAAKKEVKPEQTPLPLGERFCPDEAWIDKTGEELAAIDPSYNHERTKRIMMPLIVAARKRENIKD